jgi:predicted Zn-dependent protease
MPTPISHYCQKCLAANPLGQDLCGRCGTRLMIIVEPSSARFEVAEQGVSTEEHLLERISIVENRITRLTERLERSLDLLLRQAQNAYFDRSLIKTLISLLSEDGVVESSRLERLWNERCEKEALEQQESSTREAIRLKILAAPPATDSKAFAELVGEGFLALEGRKTAIGIDKLQQAAAMTDSNSALNLFIGEHFFKHGKTQIARSYLAKVHEASPDDVRVALLLGLTCANEGDAETAKALIAIALERGGSCFAGHCGLGWLHMIENKWRNALKQFKRALDIRPSPEAHYALGCFYFNRQQYAFAIRHLRRVTQMDDTYLEAFVLLARAYFCSGQEELSVSTLRSASSVMRMRNGEGKSTELRRRVSLRQVVNMSTTARLITEGEKRLSRLIRTDALQGFKDRNSN